MTENFVTDSSQTQKHFLQVVNMLEALYPEQSSSFLPLRNKIESHSYSSSDITQQLKNIRQSLLLAKDQDATAMRMVVQNIRTQMANMAKSPNLSGPSKSKLKDLPLHDGASPAEALKALSALCLSFANETAHLRSQSETIVGDAHSNLKKDDAKIIAGDVAWSSRQILNSLMPLLQRAQITYPDNDEIKKIVTQTRETLKQSAVDFYDALSLMEEATKLLTRIQGKKHNAEAAYLKTFQSHLKTMHQALSESIKNSAAFQSSSDRDKEKMIENLERFKEASEKQDDPDILRKLISENVDAMKQGMDTMMTKQNAFIRQQQRAMSSMQTELREQKRQHEKLVDEHNILKTVYAETEGMALRDEMTQSGNRRAFDIAVEKMDAWVKKHDAFGACGLIVLDLDRFKSINDQYGHAAGDQILSQLGQLVNQLIEKPALKGRTRLYRYGGEEFVILCHKMRKKDIYSIAEILRKTIEEHAFKVDDRELKCTASFGVARYSKLDKTGEAVFKIADETLYKAKGAGRNRVFVYEDGKFKRIRPRDEQNKRTSTDNDDAAA